MTRRTQRVNELLREQISELLLRQAKDPRLTGIVTITEVSTSPDLRQATVFVSIMASEEERQTTLRGLSAASRFLRWELTRRLSMRRVPELSFVADESIERGAHLLDLIREVGPPAEGDTP
ncbi:MAG: 30S ribosome-binding factor RbfA [Dehalococcoidia bacterium]